MPLAPEERQGYLGKLEDKTITELKDLLFRQEKLLCKQAFLRSLPDKGGKVKQFAESIERLIHEKVAQEKSQSFTSRQDIINLTSAFSSVQNVKNLGECSSSHQQDVTEVEDPIRSMINPAALSGGNTKMIVDKREIDPLYSEIETIADSLTESFQKVRVSDIDFDQNIQTIDKSVNHYENVIRRAEQRPKTKRAPFKPNSSLVISKVENLPDKYKHKSKAGDNSGNSKSMESSETVPTLKDKTHEESAAYPPAYKYDRAILVSDEESRKLIKEQQSKLEELLAQRAAARLAERLNIKMDSYKPKEVDISYRQKKEYKDSDDDEDDDQTEVCSYPD